ncbi:LysR family transcriptional regulator [Acetobacterium fimetarium]|uniref:LysR family transcriptional regulator n=1 Tax=Acetobacterium fimetarium TaxID=52691 RepID=A0ABR6WT05_9FIRM|nr:selenium metabolism-associated LysR family transcriptional regulator [Acetobacterium fimetarium]MBC3803670.1 LysR family transcriptional regulator [Acetobacterium fimetarium]
MEFKQLEVFVNVVEQKSFSAAAKKLFLTQSTVSVHIRSLENELNNQLINRTTRTFFVTKDGKKLYEYAKSILNLREKIYEEFNGDNERSIRIGASTIPSIYILPEVVTEYCKVHPRISFQIHQSDSGEIIEKVMKGEVDIGLVGTKPGYEECVSDPFYQDQLVIATSSSDHFMQLKKNNASSEELLKEPFVMRESGSGTRKESDLLIEKIGVNKNSLNVIATMNDQEAIIKAIINNMGISIISEKAVQNHMNEGKILVFRLGELSSYRFLYIIYKKNKVHPVHIRQFIKCIKKSGNLGLC